MSRRHLTSGIFLVAVVACLLLMQLLSGSVVSALSVTTTPHINRIRSVINSSSAHLVSTQPQFPLANAKRSPYCNHNARHLSSRRQMSSSSTIPTSNNGKLSFNNKVQLILSVLCNNSITRHFTKLRKSVIRATVILSFILLGYTKGNIISTSTPPIAHAAAYWGKSNPDVVLVDTTSTTTEAPKIKSSFGKKFTKLLVTAGAVSVGLSIVPNNGSDGGGGGSGDNGQEEDGVLSVVPKDKPSPLPLPKVMAVDEATPTKPKPFSSNANNGSISKDPILVTNLDSKIEMLRQREEIAKQAAETKRLAELANAEEARKVEQINIDARISAEAEKVERTLREKKLRMEEEKEREREEKLSELEAGKKELWRLEQIKMEQRQQVSNEEGGGGGGATNEEGGTDTTTANKTIQQQPRPLQIIATGSSGSPAKTKEEDLELTTRIILDHVNSKADEEGVVDDDDDE